MNVILTSTALKFQHENRRVVSQQWVEYLSKVRGINKWALYVGVENGCQDDIELYNHIDFMPVVFVENKDDRDVNLNHVSVWRRAFDHGSTFFAFLENDVLPAVDFCELMEQLGHKYKDDPTVFCINSYTGNEDLTKKYAVWRKPSLGAWGFGMWRDRAAECLDDYHRSNKHFIKGVGWDVHLNQMSRRHRDAIMVCYSRCLSVGMDGIHYDCYVPEININNRTWSGNDKDILNGQTESYYEIPKLSKSEYVHAKEWV